MARRQLYRHIATAPSGVKIMRDDSHIPDYTHAVLGLYSREYDEARIVSITAEDSKRSRRTYDYMCALRDGKYLPKPRAMESTEAWHSRVASDVKDARTMLDGVDDFDGFVEKLRRQGLDAISELAERGHYSKWVSLGFCRSKLEADTKKATESKSGWMARIVIVEVETIAMPSGQRK